MKQMQDVVNENIEVVNDDFNGKEVLEEEFDYGTEEVMDERQIEEIKMDDINLDQTFGLEELEEIEAVKEQIDNMIEEESNTSIEPAPSQLINDNRDFDALFDSLYNDVAGANNFISSLIEQKKNVSNNEANLKEEQEKLEKAKEEFEHYINVQKESIELEKAQCNEYIRTQKLRLQNEEAQFNAEAEAKKADLELTEASIKAAMEKLETEKTQFQVYKELEEKKISTEQEKNEKNRNKLESDIEQFNKEKEIALTKLNSEHQELENQREQFEKSREIELEKIKNAQIEILSQKEQFEKFKELEEKKLELESKNLSQSCARFKELVSQFNSGFQQLPDSNK